MKRQNHKRLNAQKTEYTKKRRKVVSIVFAYNFFVFCGEIGQLTWIKLRQVTKSSIITRLFVTEAK